MKTPLAMFLLFVTIGPETFAQTNFFQNLRLVPFPKEGRLSQKELPLSPEMRIEINNIPSARQGATELQAELDHCRHVATRIKLAPSARETFFWLALSKRGVSFHTVEVALGPLPEPAESYALAINDKFAAVGARQPAGLLHGIQTLRQLIRANAQGDRLPGLAIRDWPSLRYRGFSDDITRGPSPTPATLMREVDLSEFLRMNIFSYYLENQFAFHKHPLIGPKEGSLKPEELKSLGVYADERGIEVIGNQQSFGHFAAILQHEQYADLRETPNVLCPVNEKTYQFLDDLYSEQAPLLRSRFFNVCCDETDGLGTGPSKTLAGQIGVGGVYTRHLRRIHDLLKEHYGKRMMMWGDIILNHPNNLAEIPKDTVLLSWGYDARDSFDSQITPFSQSGFEFFVCPGVSCWNRVLPDFQVAAKNISNFVRDGVKHHALGMLNTTWDDDGENLAGPNWHGIAWGAECAWNGSSTLLDDFNRRIGAVLFGEPGLNFGEAIASLGQAHRLSAFEDMTDNAFWNCAFPHWFTNSEADTQAVLLRDHLASARAKLELTSQSAIVNADILDTYLFGARRMELMALRVLEGRQALRDYQVALFVNANTPSASTALENCAGRVRKLRDAGAGLKENYIQLWRRENRPYALDVVTGRYDAMIAYYDDLLKRIDSAAAGLKNGQRLPAAETIGLVAGGKN